MKTILFIIVMSNFITGQSQPEKSLNSMVETERAFSALSVEKGVKTAFLSFFSDEAVVFDPGPVNGKKVYSEMEERPGKLEWKPSFADIASSGEMGYTFGPWKFSLDTVNRYGHFVTVWKKQPSGRWKVAVDLGITHPPVEFSKVNLISPLKARVLLSGGKPAEQISGEYELIRLDSILSLPGSVDKYGKFYSPSASYFIQGEVPVKGIADMMKLKKRDDPYDIFNPVNAGISASGDLGYSYGMAGTTDNGGVFKEKAGYLRIWKKEDGRKWKIVLEIIRPVE